MNQKTGSKRKRSPAKAPGLSALQISLLSAMILSPTDWPRTFNWVSQPGKRHWLDAVILALLRRGLVRKDPETAPGWFLTPEGATLIREHLERLASALSYVDQKQAATPPTKPL